MENPKLPHGLDRVLPFRRFGQMIGLCLVTN
jgi:hypothetical protein